VVFSPPKLARTARSGRAFQKEKGTKLGGLVKEKENSRVTVTEARLTISTTPLQSAALIQVKNACSNSKAVGCAKAQSKPGKLDQTIHAKRMRCLLLYGNAREVFRICNHGWIVVVDSPGATRLSDHPIGG
jgi:hypothetical protein